MASNRNVKEPNVLLPYQVLKINDNTVRPRGSRQRRLGFQYVCRSCTDWSNVTKSRQRETSSSSRRSAFRSS